MEFVAIDFETANKCYSSICQVGVVVFRSGEPVDNWGTYVNPEEEFDSKNIGVHGVVAEDVVEAPKFHEIYPKLLKLLSGRVVVSHGHFDFYVLLDSARKAGLKPINCKWINTIKIAKKAWPEIPGTSYKLNSLAEYLGLELKHHNAESDAKVAGEIFVEASRVSGKLLKDWIIDVGVLKENPKRKTPQFNIAGDSNKESSFQKNITRKGNENGLLFGKRVLFTGDLSISRKKAADLADSVGCAVVRSVTKKTPLIVVVGELDSKLLKGKSKSQKLLDAEEYRAAGCDISIIDEKCFFEMVSAQ